MKIFTIKNLMLLLCLSAASVTCQAQSNNKISVDDLLIKVKEGHRRDQQVNQERLDAFRADRQKQQQLLSDVKRQRADAEA